MTVIVKVWPHSEFPLIPVGKMVLNRNPNNYFSEVEQIAFSPASLVPGIEPSPDKMLQVSYSSDNINVTIGLIGAFYVLPKGRLFSYNDTHRHRLGANFSQLPVNCPYRTKVCNYQRDGPQALVDNQS